MAESPEQADQPQQGQSPFRRDENFEALYANNVQMFPTEWDLRIVFGELDVDPETNNQFVMQHTSIALPWLQAKLGLYFLMLQLGVYEITHGKIKLPASLIPPEATPPTGDLANDPAAQQLYEFIKNTREQFLKTAT